MHRTEDRIITRSDGSRYRVYGDWDYDTFEEKIVTPEQQLIYDYEAGTSIKELCGRYGRGEQAVRNIIKGKSFKDLIRQQTQ